ncbi:MAG TPA: hypothetical protein VGE96_00965 [Steroidobacteraceae bacterium]|jgi:hypothetical protein
MRLPKFIRRAWHRARVTHHERRIQMLSAQRYAALQKLRAAREDLFFVDLGRPPITSVYGRTPMYDVLAKRAPAPTTKVR